jgi:co-chaperonin GroES (HSP10)
MSIEAVKTRVLFTRKEVEKQTASGIVLSNPQQETNPLGYVTSIGPEVNITMNQGDAIVVNWQSVGMIEYDGVTYYIVDQNNINAVIKNDQDT